MTEAKEYLFIHAYFQFEVLANHDEPNPPFRQAEKKAIVSLGPSRSTSLRAADSGECTQDLNYLNQFHNKA